MTQHPDPCRRKLVEGLTPARKGPDPRAAGAGAPASPRALVRIGHGYDIHRLQSGGKLVLGGVVVADDISPIAHSDGDVVIHALIDALLGAMAWGDIGQMFPDDDPQWQGAAGRVLLEQVYSKVRQAGYRLSNADITLLLERPKIGAFRTQMAENLRQLTGNSGAINLKAGTNEGCDSIGRAEAVAAHAVVLLAAE